MSEKSPQSQQEKVEVESFDEDEVFTHFNLKITNKDGTITYGQTEAVNGGFTIKGYIEWMKEHNRFAAAKSVEVTPGTGPKTKSLQEFLLKNNVKVKMKNRPVPNFKAGGKGIRVPAPPSSSRGVKPTAGNNTNPIFEVEDPADPTNNTPQLPPG